MNESKNKDIMNIGYYVVAYMDLLNQKEVLASMEHLPSTEDDMELFKDKLKKTYGKVKAFRNLYDEYYKGFNKSLLKSPLNTISDYIPQLKQLRGQSFNKHCFSDTVVYYSPLIRSDDYLGINNVYSIIAPIAPLQLCMLAGQSAFRGGIDIGTACEYLKDEIYGNAICKAYHIENKIAGYPRIVIGKSLLEYINHNISMSDNEPTARHMQATSMLCKEFIKVDYDNLHVINPVCEQVRKMLGDKFNEIYAKALSFVKSETIRFKNSDNQKLYERYQNLENLLRL